MNSEVCTICIELDSSQATEELGFKLGSLVEEQMVVALVGPLGAGKTTFAKGVAEGLHVEEVVNSPTFTMLNEYTSGRIPLYHLDLYRTRETHNSAEGAPYAGLSWLLTELEELHANPGLILIEWADFLDEWIAQQDRILIELNYSKNAISTNGDSDEGAGVGRNATLSAVGEKSSKLLKALQFI